MHGLFAFAAPLALMLPMMAGAAGLADQTDAAPTLTAPQCDAAPMQGEPALTNPLTAFRASATARQVRIEQRVVVRIAPQGPAARQNLL
ncbi:MAG: hypothetical protein CVT87_06615, partial [Alphaproteobacteria bacterium HGW-Alphaproteobacteria-9]